MKLKLKYKVLNSFTATIKYDKGSYLQPYIKDDELEVDIDDATMSQVIKQYSHYFEQINGALSNMLDDEVVETKEEVVETKEEVVETKEEVVETKEEVVETKEAKTKPKTRKTKAKK